MGMPETSPKQTASGTMSAENKSAEAALTESCGTVGYGAVRYGTAPVRPVLRGTFHCRHKAKRIAENNHHSFSVLSHDLSLSSNTYLVSGPEELFDLFDGEKEFDVDLCADRQQVFVRVEIRTSGRDISCFYLEGCWAFPELIHRYPSGHVQNKPFQLPLIFHTTNHTLSARRIYQEKVCFVGEMKFSGAYYFSRDYEMISTTFGCYRFLAAQSAAWVRLGTWIFL